MRFLLINQFDAASGAPTGRILAELSAGLQKSGHQVSLVSCDSHYGTTRRGLRRILHEGFSHFVLLVRALRGPQPDAVISLTSPVCLVITGDLVSRLRHAKHFHWAMDLYPDVALELGEIRDGSFAKGLRAAIRAAYQRAARVVALDEDMRDHLQSRYGVESSVIGPFPPAITWPPPEKIPKPARQWLYSGNLGRAHDVEVLLQVQRKLEDRGVEATLALQGQGAQFASSQESAARLGLRHIEWRTPVPDSKLGESLLQANVLVVTRKAAMKGLLLPSKLILAELSGRTILWIGDTNGKTAQRLKKSGRHGVYAVDEIEAIADWLQLHFKRAEENSSIPPKPTYLCREEAIRQWATLLQE
jgi:colanic acid biosynthesis glycosyl transferase WcaI